MSRGSEIDCTLWSCDTGLTSVTLTVGHKCYITVLLTFAMVRFKRACAVVQPNE